MAKSSFTRRKFLKMTALSSSTLAVGGCTSLDRFFIGDKRDLRTEVVILGAGAAGLAAAFELKKNKIPFRIFEASSRVGGRVQSAAVFPGGGPVGELGAEFIESRHSHVFELAKELNLPLKEIETVKGSDAHLFAFNKKVYKVRDFSKRMETLRKPLDRAQRDLFRDESVILSFQNVLQYEKSSHFDFLSLKALLNSWQTEVDPLVLKLIEVQAVNRFGVEAIDQSSLHFLSTVENGTSSLLAGQPIYRMEGGLSRLTQTLASRVAGVIPDQILKLNCPLVKIVQEHDFFALTFDCETRKETFRTKNIICTIPFSKLREIEGIAELNFSKQKKDNIRVQEYATHSKGAIGFAEPFWRKPNKNISSNLGNFTGDFSSQKIWDSGRGQEGTQGLLTYQRGGNLGLKAGANSAIEAIEDLRFFYGDIPPVLGSALTPFVNWEQRKWSRGSMAVFKPGQYMLYNGVAAVPEFEGHFLFAGEHTSLQYPGTLQGAVESGLKAAFDIGKHFNVQG